MSRNEVRVHEITFCARWAKWSEEVFREQSALHFKRVEIEESKSKSRKRSDLRVYDRHGNLVLTGEMKLPGTPEGRFPDSFELVDGAYRKASNAGAPFFFTSNVNALVLFDTRKWHLPPEERRMEDHDLRLFLEHPQDVDRPEVVQRIKEFLATFYPRFAEILAGRKPDWAQPLDVCFVRSFERQLGWPERLTADYMQQRAGQDKAFDARLQDWMAKSQSWTVFRKDPSEWRRLVDRAASTLCYVFANRLLFYESVRAKFRELEALRVFRRAGAEALYAQFQKAFQGAVEATGDYETLFYPYDTQEDWLGPLIFAHPEAPDAWRAVIERLVRFDLRNIRTDVLGDIFKRFIAPEERHRFGQFYTSEDLVDLINAFCIRRGADRVMDPACGSGSFLVRAYHRKAFLDPKCTHEELLGGTYGVDIALFAAHLATLNLASRDVQDAENYPRVRRGNFFEVIADVLEGRAFCRLPRVLREPDGSREKADLPLPELDAAVGNPPWVRQEMIPRRGQKGASRLQAKEEIADLLTRMWPRLKLSGRSDLHCYFWPAATWRLKEGGWFGFLVSSSWLDVEYGFALQEWVLRNFTIHAILESDAEPWFEDARVKSCAVILQRCREEKERREHLVKFVRLNVPLAAILGRRDTENARQKAAERLRDRIARTKESASCADYRIIVKKQVDLWEEGLRAGRLFELQKRRGATGPDGNAQPQTPPLVVRERAMDETDENGEAETDENGNGVFPEVSETGYGGGKWGKYLRAPDLYFDIMKRFGDRFVPLGEIATIRFGVKSGCDAFFMPKDVSAEMLARYDKLNWNGAPFHAGCKRSEVEAGEVKLVLAGDGSVHPIEAVYLAPEVHSLMTVKRPIVRADDLDRLILLVSEPIGKLKGTYVAKYLHYGERRTFTSKKSKAVPVAKRSTCAARDPWYDLTYTQRGHIVWPKSQQYRHIVVHNVTNLIVNCNLYDVTVDCPTMHPVELTAAILNSTLVAWIKTFYGRYAGTEGNLKTEVVDVNLLEIPDPRNVTPEIADKLREAFGGMCQRDTGGMVEDDLMECHSPERARILAARPLALPWELRQPDRRALDLAVFELLGVADGAERERLCDELYREVAAHFRRIRLVEIQKQEQRKNADKRTVNNEDLAADIWDSLPEEERDPLTAWIERNAVNGLEVVIPEGKPSLPDAGDMFGSATVFFRTAKGASAGQLALPSRIHAELVWLMAAHGIQGNVALPASEKDAVSLLDRVRDRLRAFAERADELSRSRTGDERRIENLTGLLLHWFIHGKPERKREPNEAAQAGAPKGR